MERREELIRQMGSSSDIYTFTSVHLDPRGKDRSVTILHLYLVAKHSGHHLASSLGAFRDLGGAFPTP